MKSTIVKGSILSTVIAVLVVWWGALATAGNVHTMHTGIFGVAPDDTALLNVYVAADRARPGGIVVLSFHCAGNEESVEKEIRNLAVGDATYIELSYSAALTLCDSVGQDGTSVTNDRVQIYAEVAVFTLTLVASVEVYGPDGKTHLFIGRSDFSNFSRP